MAVLAPVAAVAPPEPPTDAPARTIPQYSRRAIFAIWAAAALPMGILAWIVAPNVASQLDGPPFFRVIVVSLLFGLVWQFLLVMGLVYFEQRNLRWSTLREVLWLRSPVSPRTGRRGGRTWLVLIPLVVGFGLHDLVPSIPHYASRDLGLFLESDAGQSFMSGAWGWFGVMLVMFAFNTFLGEELLFRGFLLPRMEGAFGRRDWLVNGAMFAAYHVHVPWIMPVTLIDAFVMSYPSKYYRSAWIGIAVHSAQSVFLALAVLGLVVSS